MEGERGGEGVSVLGWREREKNRVNMYTWLGAGNWYPFLNGLQRPLMPTTQ